MHQHMTCRRCAVAADSSMGGSAPAGSMGGGCDDVQSRLFDSGARPGWCVFRLQFALLAKLALIHCARVNLETTWQRKV